MSYQIYDASDGSWIKVREPSGLFGYVFNPKEADVFARHDDAERALARFHAQLGPTGARFKIRTVEEPRTEYIRTDGQLFVGGPLDGTRLAVPAESNTYLVQVPASDPSPVGYWPSRTSFDIWFRVDTAIYQRQRLVAAIDYQHPTQHHDVFVYAGIQNPRPKFGEEIVYNCQRYLITLVSEPKGIVKAEYRGSDRIITITVLESGLQPANGSWVPRSGAVIEMLVQRSITVV